MDGTLKPPFKAPKRTQAKLCGNIRKPPTNSFNAAANHIARWGFRDQKRSSMEVVVHNNSGTRRRFAKCIYTYRGVRLK